MSALIFIVSFLTGAALVISAFVVMSHTNTHKENKAGLKFDKLGPDKPKVSIRAFVKSHTTGEQQGNTTVTLKLMVKGHDCVTTFQVAAKDANELLPVGKELMFRSET